LALAGQIGVGHRRGAFDAAPGTTGELASSGGGTADDRRNLVEGQVEHVVQHEGQSLGRSQRVQHHEQCQTDGVGQQRFMFRVDPVLTAGGRLGHVLERLLAARVTGAQHVQTHPRHHRGQPRGEVLDAAGVCPAEPKPGFLNGVVGLTRRTEHPDGYRPETTAVLLEALGQPFVFFHRVTFLPRDVSQK
jgi:hypothetical protein